MLRVSLLTLSVLFVFVALLTAVKSPDWAPWRLAVLAGEYGHWLALGALGVAGLAWVSRGGAVGVAVATVLMCAVAFGLLLKPAVEAGLIGAELPAKLTGAFGAAPVARAPFSLAGLVARGLEPGRVETRAFADGLALDLYRATRADAKPAPCVIVVHGGGWDSGDRGQLPQFNHWIARRGYAVAAISYRLAPKSIWPAQRDDLLAAIAYLKAHAGELGLDPTRFVLLGRSAGGQIAEVVGYAAHDPAIRGVVGLYAPSDMHFALTWAREDDVLKSPTLIRQYLGGTPATVRAAYDSASALPQVTPASPPTLLLHGANDALVWHRHSERLAARLAECGVPHAFVSLPWATHAFEFNLAGPGGQMATFALEWFLAAVTK